jgi:hypothetical protein
MARTRSSNDPSPAGTAATRIRPSSLRRTPRSVTTLVTLLAGRGHVATVPGSPPADPT